MSNSLEDFTTAIPRLFLAGGTDVGAPQHALGSPPTRGVWVVTGIDVYPGIQPNNGDFQLLGNSLHWPVANAIVYQVQQSQNFPGPFSWRGKLPMWHGDFGLTASSSVPGSWLVWGYETLDFWLDWYQDQQ